MGKQHNNVNNQLNSNSDAGQFNDNQVTINLNYLLATKLCGAHDSQQLTSLQFLRTFLLVCTLLYTCSPAIFSRKASLPLSKLYILKLVNVFWLFTISIRKCVESAKILERIKIIPGYTTESLFCRIYEVVLSCSHGKLTPIVWKMGLML